MIRSEMTWQPIETMPGSGVFLIFVPTAKKAPIKLARPNNLPEWAIRDGFTTWDERGNPQRATHWMPLPEPPK